MAENSEPTRLIIVGQLIASLDCYEPESRIQRHKNKIVVRDINLTTHDYSIQPSHNGNGHKFVERNRHFLEKGGVGKLTRIFYRECDLDYQYAFGGIEWICVEFMKYV